MRAPGMYQTALVSSVMSTKLSIVYVLLSRLRTAPPMYATVYDPTKPYAYAGVRASHCTVVAFRAGNSVPTSPAAAVPPKEHASEKPVISPKLVKSSPTLRPALLLVPNHGSTSVQNSATMNTSIQKHP